MFHLTCLMKVFSVFVFFVLFYFIYMVRNSALVINYCKCHTHLILKCLPPSHIQNTKDQKDMRKF